VAQRRRLRKAFRNVTPQCLAEWRAHLYFEIMATRDEPPTAYADALARLKATSAKAERARQRTREIEDEARADVAAALAAGLAEGAPGFRAEVQRASPFSPPVVRAIGEKAGIAPDDRYVRTVTKRANS
jgi:hypothetical protein